MVEEKSEQASVKRRPTKYPDLWIYPSGTIYLRFHKKALGQVEMSTGETTLAKARNRADAMKAELLGLKKKSVVNQLMFEDLWDDYLSGIRGRRESTNKRDEQIGRQWLMPFFGDKLLGSITDDVWESYIEHVHDKSPRLTLFSHKKTLVRFLNWAVTKGHIEKVPKLRNPDAKSQAGRVYSKSEIEALLQTSKKSYPDLYLHILMSVTMGTRASENCSLSWDRVDLSKKTIQLTPEVTKTKKGRTFSISKETLKPLSERYGKTAYVFPMPTDPERHVKKDYFNKAWAKVKQISNVTGRARFHDLRHTFLTYAFKKNINPLLICDYAGLDIKVAQKVYLHFTAEDTRAVASPIDDLALGEN